MSYAKGRAFEYRVRNYLEKHEYFWVRSAGSKGAADLVALKDGLPSLLIQCKRHGAMAPLEWNTLLIAAAEAGAEPILARNDPKHHIELLRLVYWKDGKGGKQPMEPFSL